MPAKTKAPAKRNVAKQEAKASKQAKVIKKEAVSKVKAHAATQPHPEWATERAVDCSDADWKDGCRVREMRETGMSWLNIGNEMNYSPGKTGAGQARRAYKKAFGSLPETARSRASGEGGSSRKPKAEAVRGNAAEKLERMDDEEVIEYLANKRIRWHAVSLSSMKDTAVEWECRVGRRPRVLKGKYGRYITFNEPDAGSRSIYLHAIHTVSS